MDSISIECWYLRPRREPLMGMTQPEKYEFKVTVLPEEEHLVRAELKQQGAEMRMREVYFYDTPGLELKDLHLFLRARTTEGDEPDSTVKLRPGVPADWDGADDARHEADVIGDAEISSLKLDRAKGKIDKGDVGGGAKALFDEAQDKLVPRDLDKLEALGPVHAHLWELEYDELPKKKLSVEEWTVSGGPHFIELSFKAKPDEKAAAKHAFHALLERLGINPKGDPDPKTTRVLKHFADKL
jgi:hypothetical protein